MRSLVLAAVLATTAAVAVVGVMAIDEDAPRPAGRMAAGSAWAAAEPAPAPPTTTLAEVAVKGVPITGGTDPSPSTPPPTAPPPAAAAAPATTPAPTTTTTAPPPPTAPPTTTTTAPPASEPFYDHAYASSLLSLANGSRTARGLASLTWSDTLASAARSAAVRMADAGALVHRADLQSLLGPFSTLGENIGRGYAEPSAIHAAWMASGSHRDNLLAPSFTQVGIAVWVDASGQPWVSQVFGG